MRAYFDSSVIVKLYVRENNSDKAIALVKLCSQPGILTFWQEIEIRNCLRLKAARKEITVSEMERSLADLDSDILRAVWQRLTVDRAWVENKAEELSSQHFSLNCRTLDILHVATALAADAQEFVTFDHRQASLAKAIGLAVKPEISPDENSARPERKLIL